MGMNHQPNSVSQPVRLLVVAFFSVLGSVSGWWVVFVPCVFLFVVSSAMFRIVLAALLLMVGARSLADNQKTELLLEAGAPYLTAGIPSWSAGDLSVVTSQDTVGFSSLKWPQRPIVQGRAAEASTPSAVGLSVRTGHTLADRIAPVRLAVFTMSLVDSSAIHSGDLVLFDFRPRPIYPPRNPHDPYFVKRRPNSADLISDIPALLIVVHDHPLLSRLGTRTIQEHISRRITTRFAEEAAALVEAMVLGRRHLIDPAIREAFIQSGVIHLLAVSGLHFGIVVTLLSLGVKGLVHRLPVHPSLRRSMGTVLMMVGCFLFATLVGWGPSVFRAWVMTCCFILSLQASRPRTLESSFSTALFILVMIRPDDVYSVGMHLSFLAVGGIASGLRITRKSRQKKERFKAAFIISSCASLASAPAILWHIGFVPLVTLLSSPVLIPVASLALSLSVLALLTPFSIEVLNQLASWMMGLLINGSLIMSSAELLPVLEAGRTLVVPISIAMCSALLLPFLHAGWKVRWISCVCLFISACFLFLPGPRLRATFLDVGQGDSALIHFPDRRVLIVDTGPGAKAAAILKRELTKRSIRGKPAVLLSHGDRDHTGGLPVLVESVGSFTLMAAFITEGISRNISSTKRVRRGQHLINSEPNNNQSSSYRVYVLHPTDLGDDNNDSVVLLVIFGTTRILFTGDIEQQTEDLLVR